MDVTPLVKSGQQIIQSYAAGSFKVSGQSYQGAVIVTPDSTSFWKAPESVAGLKPEHLKPLMDSRPDVILVGTGKGMQMLSPADLKLFKNNRLNIELMDTGAACRTYNVLMAEGRRVAAALFPVL